MYKLKRGRKEKVKKGLVVTLLAGVVALSSLTFTGCGTQVNADTAVGKTRSERYSELKR